MPESTMICFFSNQRERGESQEEEAMHHWSRHPGGTSFLSSKGALKIKAVRSCGLWSSDLLTWQEAEMESGRAEGRTQDQAQALAQSLCPVSEPLSTSVCPLYHSVLSQISLHTLSAVFIFPSNMLHR